MVRWLSAADGLGLRFGPRGQPARDRGFPRGARERRPAGWESRAGHDTGGGRKEPLGRRWRPDGTGHKWDPEGPMVAENRTAGVCPQAKVLPDDDVDDSWRCTGSLDKWLTMKTTLNRRRRRCAAARHIQQRLDMGSAARHGGSTWAAARQAAARHGQRLDKQRLDMAVAIDGWWTVGPN
ncbi:hypothetical protein RB195_002587 [Necator americanus]|uniref:Uncharacterized protein n=1 Tax=Necator americanus TaxID=51031 RepID=A0ABR1DK06_NECAM